MAAAINNKSKKVHRLSNWPHGKIELVECYEFYSKVYKLSNTFHAFDLKNTSAFYWKEQKKRTKVSASGWVLVSLMKMLCWIYHLLVLKSFFCLPFLHVSFTVWCVCAHETCMFGEIWWTCSRLPQSIDTFTNEHVK